MHDSKTGLRLRNVDIRIASALALALAASAAGAQTTTTPTPLAPIDVEGGRIKGADAPVEGYVAERSATATKTDIPLIESPQSVSVIGREQIEDRGADTLAEAVEYAPGVNTANSVNNDVIDSNGIQIRGFSAADATYRDGTRLFAGLPYDAPIEAYGVERIEVLRGPASVLYGQGQPGGIINLVTKQPTDTPLREIGLEMGTFHHKQLKADVSDRLDSEGKWRYRLTGLVQESGTPIEYIDDDRVYIAPALSWTPNAATKLTLLARYQKSQSDYYWTGFPLAGTKRPNPTTGERIPEDRYIGQPGLGGYDSEVYEVGYLFEHLINDRLTFEQNVRYRQIDYDVVDVFRNYFGASPPFNNDLTTLERDIRVRYDDADTLTADQRLIADVEFGGIDHNLLVGLDYKSLDYDSRTSGFLRVSGQAPVPDLDLYDPDYTQSFTVPDAPNQNGTEASQYGLYVQDHMKFADKWALTVGARQDWVDEQSLGADKNDQDELSWRAGLVYLADNGVAPYVSYSESFVPQYGVNEVTGETLDPISGEQYEAGVRYRPDGWNASFELAAFEITRQNETVALPSNPTVQSQIGETRSRGAEASAQIDLARGLKAIASYTYNEVEVVEAGGSQTTNGNRVPDRPDHLAKLWVDYSFQQPALDGLGLGAGLRYTSSSFADAANEARYPSATLVDASVRYSFDDVTLQLSGRNIFDEVKLYCNGSQATSFCDYGVPRTVVGSLTYRW
ncbi:TonB-dependent siderophore receptor [uncultured Salinisphaera sp.]|uniref:TonB-dependent siderophore receptor n=1 Tax=uncultured Salinisphaera sp. TaxID=359372 RepID=UPI0032B0FCAA